MQVLQVTEFCKGMLEVSKEHALSLIKDTSLSRITRYSQQLITNGNTFVSWHIGLEHAVCWSGM